MRGYVIQGPYDGYGRIESEQAGTIEIIEQSCNGDWNGPVKLYHTDCYEKAGRPDYDQAKFSNNADDQGYFFNKEEIIEALTGGKPCVPMTLGEAEKRGLPTAGPFYESQPKKEKP